MKKRVNICGVTERCSLAVNTIQKLECIYKSNFLYIGLFDGCSAIQFVFLQKKNDVNHARLVCIARKRFTTRKGCNLI